MTINFITPEEAKEYTELPNNIDNSQLEESISFAQEEHINYLLGDALYIDISNELEAGSVSDNNTALLDALKLTLCYYTHYEAMPFIVFQTRKSGLISRTGQDSETVSDLDTIEYYRVAIRKRAIKHQTKLIKWLNTNKEDFPLWTSEHKDCDPLIYKDRNGVFFY